MCTSITVFLLGGGKNDTSSFSFSGPISRIFNKVSPIPPLSHCGFFGMLFQRLRAAEAEGLHVTTPAYNAAFKAFATGKAREPGFEFLRRMRREGRVPLDEQTLNIAIELCKECGDTAGAVAMLEEMRADGVSKEPGL